MLAPYSICELRAKNHRLRTTIEQFIFITAFRLWRFSIRFNHSPQLVSPRRCILTTAQCLTLFHMRKPHNRAHKNCSEFHWSWSCFFFLWWSLEKWRFTSIFELSSSAAEGNNPESCRSEKQKQEQKHHKLGVDCWNTLRTLQLMRSIINLTKEVLHCVQCSCGWTRIILCEPIKWLQTHTDMHNWLLNSSAWLSPPHRVPQRKRACKGLCNSLEITTEVY